MIVWNVKGNWINWFSEDVSAVLFRQVLHYTVRCLLPALEDGYVIGNFWYLHIAHCLRIGHEFSNLRILL